MSLCHFQRVTLLAKHRRPLSDQPIPFPHAGLGSGSGALCCCVKACIRASRGEGWERAVLLFFASEPIRKLNPESSD